jgi:hypothetical protein
MLELEQQIVMRRTAIQIRHKRDLRVSLALAFHIIMILYLYWKPTALLIFVDPHTSSSPPWQALHYMRRIYLTLNMQIKLWVPRQELNK